MASLPEQNYFKFLDHLALFCNSAMMAMHCRLRRASKSLLTLMGLFFASMIDALAHLGSFRTHSRFGKILDFPELNGFVFALLIFSHILRNDSRRPLRTPLPQ
jgi:hypothetical protein